MTEHHRVDVSPGTVRWFGHDWGAPICERETHRPTPVDRPCAGCNRGIYDVDRGVGVPFMTTDGPGKGTDKFGYLWWHFHCWMAEVVGPVASTPVPCDYGRLVTRPGALICLKGIYEDSADNVVVLTDQEPGQPDTLRLCDEHMEFIEGELQAGRS